MFEQQPYHFVFFNGLRKLMNNELKAGMSQGFQTQGGNTPEEGGPPKGEPSPSHDCWVDCLQTGPHPAPAMGTRSGT